MIGNYHKAEMLGVTTETFKKKSVHKVSRHQESCPTQTRLVLEHFHSKHLMQMMNLPRW